MLKAEEEVAEMKAKLKAMQRSHAMDADRLEKEKIETQSWAAAAEAAEDRIIDLAAAGYRRICKPNRSAMAAKETEQADELVDVEE